MSGDKPGWAHLAVAFGGAILGAAWTRNAIAESKKSRAERDFPDDAESLCAEVGEVLDAWEPEEYWDAEDDFTDDLADYLREEIDAEAEILVRPQTGLACPDILVDGLLALELNVNHSKGELDRCIGQCAGYARHWVTWMVLVGADPEIVERAEQVLQHQGLEHIAVWAFP